jgi:hypothetical protein
MWTKNRKISKPGCLGPVLFACFSALENQENDFWAKSLKSLFNNTTSRIPVEGLGDFKSTKT